MRLTVLVFCLIALLDFAPAQEGRWNLQKIRPLSDPAWADLGAILLDSGRVGLSPTAPFSDARILAEIAEIDPASLSGPAQLARIRLVSALGGGPRIVSGVFGATLGLNLSPALEWRSSKGVPWIRGYAERPPMLGFPVELAFSDSVYGFGELAITPDADMVDALPGSGLGLNLAEFIAAPIGVDGTFPFRAFGSLGGDWWNLEIGRDKLSLGSAGNHNLTISSAAEFYDFARLTLFSPVFAYSALVVQLNPERNIYLHRFDMRFGGAFSFGLTEASLVGRAPLELRFLNPLMVFHGFEAWSDYQWAGISYKDGTSNEVGFELNWSPWKGLALSAQYQMNQISDPLKMVFWPDAVSKIADGMSWLAGVDLRLPFGESFIVVKAHAVYATPLDYLSLWTPGNPVSQVSGSPVSWIYDRPSKSNYPGADGRSLSWIGFAEGPDTLLGTLSLGLDAAGAWGLMGDMTIKSQGQNSSFATVDTGSPSLALLRTPSGIAENSLTAGFSAKMELPLPMATLGGNLTGALHWTGRWNAVHVAGAFDQSWELDLSATCSLR